jgi:hypothetical protein
MIDYCTDQWMILNYPAGSGGKFIGNCLFLFDKVAHWYGGMHKQQDTVDFFKKTILDSGRLWLHKELNNNWNISFFSRCYPRNNAISSSKFNELVNANASDYFHDCWNNNLDIVDFWCKPVFPEFWKNANSVTVVLDDMEIYKNLTLSKLYKIDRNKETIISLLDVPDGLATDDNKANAQFFKNEYEFPLDNLDSFFETNVKLKPWLNPWLDNSLGNNKFTIKISELVNHDAFVQKFQWFEDYYKQKIPVRYITELHNTWSVANEQQQEYFNSSR